MILDKKRKTPKPLILLVFSVFLLARHVGFEPTTFTTFVYFSMAESSGVAVGVALLRANRADLGQNKRNIGKRKTPFNLEISMF